MSLPTVSSRALRVAAPSTQEAAIRLDEVSVRYRVPREAAGTFKEYVIHRLLRGRLDHQEFWALRGVSLEVRRHEVFGIIGRNGAGKSTLLKVVSRIIRPAFGRVMVRGRVAPLLELGAGFHPELTGRENIFLNAALLGHGHREVVSRLAEIVEFADLGGFIDAPLRTYSSGMIARLGFSVATTWAPEILILDEVLTVGDAGFQEKCRARMSEFSQNGTTILLVSHDLAAIRDMCGRALWLDRGEVRALGQASAVIAQYQRAAAGGGGIAHEH